MLEMLFPCIDEWGGGTGKGNILYTPHVPHRIDIYAMK